LSNTSCFPEIAADAGAYFNPDSVESIEECIRKVLDDEPYRTYLIEKGKDRVKLFSWDTAANKTLEVYKWLLNKENK
jgi:Glycosyltransferase